MTYPPPILTRVLAWLRPLAAALRPTVVKVGQLVGWFLLTQGVSVVALAFFVMAAWAVAAPLGMFVCGLSLIVLERKVEIDRRSASET